MNCKLCGDEAPEVSLHELEDEGWVIDLTMREDMCVCPVCAEDVEEVEVEA